VATIAQMASDTPVKSQARTSREVAPAPSVEYGIVVADIERPLFFAVGV
jgi:hypothetical protein